MHRTRSLRLFFVLLSTALVLLVAPAAFAQMKFAVVDVQRAVMETEDGLRAQATLKKLFDKRQKELDTRQERLQRERDDIEKQQRVLSRDALQRRTEEWQRQMMELQGVFVEFNKELQKKQSELTQPILNRVLSVVRQIASQDGYDGVFDRNSVPYIRSDLDITDRVIQKYNATSTTPAGEGSATPPTAPPPAPPRAPAAPPPAAPRPAGAP
jgi:outer membrane protein